MRSRVLGAFVGVLSAAIGVGVGELVAAFVRPAAAPIVAVANRVILLTPESTKRSAIQAAGTDDKLVLLTTIYIAIAIFGAVVGTLALYKVWYGLAGVAVFGAFGVYCSLTQNAAQGTDLIPSLIGAIAAGATLWLLMWLDRDGPRSATRISTDRRRFLVGSVGVAGLAAITGFGGRAALHARFDVTAKRAALTLPKPVSPAPALPRGADLGKTPKVPYVTPNIDFYRIDTAIDVPQVDPNTWSLRIHGMVDKEVRLTYADLLARPMMERWITLCCVSNAVGGTLIGNARWLGAHLADLLREAGVHHGADQLLMTSVDGMTIGAPTAVVMDGRDAMIAVGMNGEPLPVTHGFPARIVVPGLYGYVSACKWVSDIEVTTFSSRAAYWVQGGWAQQTDIKLESRIDTPRPMSAVKVGKAIPIAGVAWDQHVGVSKVEVQVDDGPWQTARLGTVPSTDTWRQWVLPWTPPHAGLFTLRVRATDAHGTPQTAQSADVYPSGATGWQHLTVRAVGGE